MSHHFASPGSVNLNGSDDHHYRYTMPALEVKHEGKTKMKKSLLVNITPISEAVGRPVEALLQYISQSSNAAWNLDGKGGKSKSLKAYVTGHHAQADLQEQILAFIRSFVLCGHCGNPETRLEVEGAKKRRTATLVCKSCSRRTTLDPDEKCVKQMMQHMHDAHEGPVKGHAAEDARMTEFADIAVGSAAQETKRSLKQRCECGHETSKPQCKRCGRVLTEPASTHDAVEPNAQAQDLTGDVLKWMHAQSAPGITAETSADFITLLSAGHSMAALLKTTGKVVARDAMSSLGPELGQSLTEPRQIAEAVSTTMQKQVPLLQLLLGDPRSPRAGLDAVVAGIHEEVVESNARSLGEAVLFGLLLALHEHADEIPDAELCAACVKLPCQSENMRKFIKYLSE
ncbi:eIF5 [Symbiodinium natans]|uniref:eIF5 protein n=1 Tax=Symbiodinium natans TaxID=878477 RepID=A0A812GCX6_9DINO|nr:eIF5 [Symbiodinium natans]